MNRLSLLLTCLLAALLTLPAAAQKRTLKAGTLVVLETSNALSSKDAQAGQSVSLRVKYDVMVNGKAVIKAGAPGSAQVVSAEQRKGLGKEGSLSIKPTVVQAVDGQMIPLTGTGVGQSGQDTKGGTIALAVVVSPLFLLKKGKDATIPAGYEMQANVASETEVE